MNRNDMTSKGELGDRAASIAHRFTRLAEAAIDASSVIYVLKAGFLRLLGATVTLRTVRSVFAETQWPSLPVTGVADAVEVRDTVSRFPAPPETDRRPNDTRLLDFAVASSLPRISDDKTLLVAAKEQGLEYYNSLMMLALLRYRGRIDEVWYGEAFARLLKISRYGEDVLRRFDDI